MFGYDGEHEVQESTVWTAHVQAQDRTSIAGQKPNSDTFFFEWTGLLDCFLEFDFSGPIFS